MVTGRKMPRAASQTRPALALIGLAAFCGLIGCPRVFALDPSLDVSQYAHTAWTFHNGFLNGAVYTLSQAPDGYLWLGTQTGVYRFDGVRAVSFPLPGFGTTEVGALLPAHDGTLWIGTLDGLVSSKNGQLTEYPSLGRRRVNTLLEDRDGTVWAGTALGDSAGRLCAIRRDSTQCYGADGGLGASVQSLYEDSNGSLWVGARSGLWRWTPGPPIQYLPTPVNERQSLAQGDHQSGLIVALGDGIRQLTGSSATDYRVPGLPPSLDATRVLRDRAGGLWIGTETHGLIYVYDGKTSRFTHKDGLSSDQVKALFQDREGTIWVGTVGGLDRFHQVAVTSLSADEGLSGTDARSVLAARDGSMWIGMLDGLYRWKDGNVTSYQKRSHAGMVDDQINSLFEDENGRIWVSAYRGLVAFADGQFTPVPSVPVGATFAIAGDQHGGLWLSLWPDSGADSLMHLLDGKIIDQVPGPKLGGGPGTGGLSTDPDGGVWVGLFSGGLAYYSQGQVRTFPLTERPNGSVRVMDLSRDRDGTLWVATANGLTRISKGNVATLTTVNGLPCNKIHWLIEGDASSYWLYTQCGLIRVARTELDAWATDPKRTIHVATFDAADGVRLVPTLSGMHPQVAKSSDGKIWFVNYGTVSFFDPSRMTGNMLAPPVRVEQITADHRTYDAKSGLRLPPLVRDISIDYTALSLVAPEKVRFKYKLEGQDPTWREVVNDREARYSNLAPGAYRFRVIASNNSGLWNEEGATLDFRIAPAYWQTVWFRALCVVAFVSFLWMLYWLRVRQLAREFDSRLETRVEERTRIARELHDTLLQSFNGVLLRFRTAHKLLTKRPDEARQVLESAIDEARSALIEGREAVQGLRSSVIETNELGEAIRTLTEELADDTAHGRAVEVRLTIGGTSRPLRPLIRDDVYRIATEALRNAFMHSGASHIEVQLGYDARRFELHVRDDGKGIDPKLLSDEGLPGHFGLQGMRERAQSIGGKLSVSSGPASGTEVALSVPATRAYGTAEDNPSWLGRIFGDRREAKS
jgi:signal transduction histidine kinase/ligand-binding sensor domain-containing protein